MSVDVRPHSVGNEVSRRLPVPRPTPQHGRRDPDLWHVEIPGVLTARYLTKSILDRFPARPGPSRDGERRHSQHPLRFPPRRETECNIPADDQEQLAIWLKSIELFKRIDRERRAIATRFEV